MQDKHYFARVISPLNVLMIDQISKLKDHSTVTSRRAFFSSPKFIICDF